MLHFFSSEDGERGKELKNARNAAPKAGKGKKVDSPQSLQKESALPTLTLA